MPRITPHQEQQGFMTLAQNTDVDYLKLAYAQALSIKLAMPGSRYAVAVDPHTAEQIQERHHRVFDYVVTMEDDHAANETWKLSNEWQIFDLTPFKETIKLESDILFTRDCSHWWHAFRFQDVVLSQGCKNFQQQLNKFREYRKVFDSNGLPDTYSGLMYFRFSQTAHDFFNLARSIFLNWAEVRDQTLSHCLDSQPTTDLVYAIAAKILGLEKCLLPTVDFVNFTHMKNAINDWPQATAWPELVMSEYDLPMVRINNINQYHPLHYQEKSWVTDDLIERYEYEYQRRIS